MKQDSYENAFEWLWWAVAAICFVLWMTACQQEELVILGEQCDEYICLTPICDTGSDCTHGMEIHFQAPFDTWLFIQSWFPSGVNVCSIEYRTGDDFAGYTCVDYEEFDWQYYYAYKWIPANTHLSAWVTLTELPVNNSIRDFGHWQTHRDDQFEYPSEFDMKDQCN